MIEIQAEMDKVLEALNSTTDTEERRALLQHLRALLQKADGLLSEPRKVTKSAE